MEKLCAMNCQSRDIFLPVFLSAESSNQAGQNEVGQAFFNWLQYRLARSALPNLDISPADHLPLEGSILKPRASPKKTTHARSTRSTAPR
jgi:hypothetical protein